MVCRRCEIYGNSYGVTNNENVNGFPMSKEEIINEEVNISIKLHT